MSTFPLRPIKVSALIPAPPDVVFPFVADTRNDPRWCENVESVEMVAGDTIQPGTRFTFHQHLDRPGGDRMQFDVDVEVVEIGERTIRWRAEDRFQIRDISVSVGEAGDASLITQETRAVFKRKPGLTRWAYPFLARRIFTKQFEDLARVFEPE